VLATLSLNYAGIMHEKTLGREAASQLKLIQSALEALRVETNADSYTPCGPTADCNAKLRIILPGNGNWIYSVMAAGNGAGATYTATATRQGIALCTYTINQAQTDPVNNGCQP
jgi:hypothetical protein